MIQIGHFCRQAGDALIIVKSSRLGVQKSALLSLIHTADIYLLHSRGVASSWGGRTLKDDSKGSFKGGAKCPSKRKVSGKRCNFQQHGKV